MTIKSILKALYKGWMAFARILGKIQSAILLFFIYVIGVGSISIISFIFRKDFLDKRMSAAETFWHERPADASGLENCKKQF